MALFKVIKQEICLARFKDITNKSNIPVHKHLCCVKQRNLYGETPKRVHCSKEYFLFTLKDVLYNYPVIAVHPFHFIFWNAPEPTCQCNSVNQLVTVVFQPGYSILLRIVGQSDSAYNFILALPFAYGYVTMSVPVLANLHGKFLTIALQQEFILVASLLAFLVIPETAIVYYILVVKSDFPIAVLCIPPRCGEKVCCLCRSTLHSQDRVIAFGITLLEVELSCIEWERFKVKYHIGLAVVGKKCLLVKFKPVTTAYRISLAIGLQIRTSRKT